MMAVDRDFWAAKLYGAGALAFSSLKKGDRFHNPNHPEAVYVKRSANTYVDAEGRVFTAGKHAAVIPVTV